MALSDHKLDSRPRGWQARLIIAYGMYVVFSPLVCFWITVWVDRSFPSTFFYHIRPDETAGPLGNIAEMVFGVLLSYLLFFVAVFPMMLLMKAPADGIITTILFNAVAITVSWTVWGILLLAGSGISLGGIIDP